MYIFVIRSLTDLYGYSRMKTSRGYAQAQSHEVGERRLNYLLG